MAQQLKRWESPRQSGRNQKGRGGTARQRQLKKQHKLLLKRLKQAAAQDTAQNTAQETAQEISQDTTQNKTKALPQSVPRTSITILDPSSQLKKTKQRKEPTKQSIKSNQQRTISKKEWPLGHSFFMPAELLIV